MANDRYRSNSNRNNSINTNLSLQRNTINRKISRSNICDRSPLNINNSINPISADCDNQSLQILSQKMSQFAYRDKEKEENEEKEIEETPSSTRAHSRLSRKRGLAAIKAQEPPERPFKRLKRDIIDSMIENGDNNNKIVIQFGNNCVFNFGPRGI